MDLTGLLDMSYFWWSFNKVVGFGIIFLVVYIAIKAAGWLLETIVSAFNKTGRS